MAGWLKTRPKKGFGKLKIKMPSIPLPAIIPTSKAVGPSRNSLPATQVTQPVQPGNLPPASMIYGVAASALVVMGIYFLFKGHWVTGLLLLLPAGALMGFAMHFLKR